MLAAIIIKMYNLSVKTLGGHGFANLSYISYNVIQKTIIKTVGFKRDYRCLIVLKIAIPIYY